MIAGPFKHPHQRGAALIVGLVLMTVLTLLAVSTMRTSTLELAMAGNAQYHEQAVQLAEAGVNDALRRLQIDAIALGVSPAWTTSFTAPLVVEGIDQGRYEVDVNYLDCGNPPLGTQKSTYQAHYYEIVSTGLSIARGARSTVVRGFYSPTLSCDGALAAAAGS